MQTTKTPIEIDYDVKESIRTSVNKKRKFEGLEITQERYLGLMIEDLYKLLKILESKNMNFNDLFIILKKKPNGK